jgi:septum formation protein
MVSEPGCVPGSILLASASPRRAELLTAAGIRFDVCPAHIDESIRAGEDAGAYARRVAVEKARVVKAQHPRRTVLAADTVVVVNGQILGKPVDENDAKRMLRLLSGRRHEVLTAVALIGSAPPDLERDAEVGVEITAVEFAPLTDGEIDWYVESGEPADKAGAYAIQGLASRFTTRVDGSYSNVVGLPVALVYAMCTRAGILLS